MKIERNEQLTRSILDNIRASFSTPRTGVHLSDLLHVRKAYFERMDPRPLTDEECNYFVVGRGHEDALGRIAGLEITEEAVILGISLRPDFTLNLFGMLPDVPGEMKTRRRNLAKPGEEAEVYGSYLDQLRGYCALKEKTVGVLIVFSLLEGLSNRDPKNPTHPELACYVVTFTEEELLAERTRLTILRRMFEAAIEAREFSGLPLCEAWMCGRARKTVVQQGFCTTCGILAEPWLSKHTATKKGEGHMVVPEQVVWQYEPKCKWYDSCQPWTLDPSRGGAQ